MIWVGLSGGMGCGKSTVLKIFEKQGHGVVSADKIVKELYYRQDVIQQVCETLGLDEKQFSFQQVSKLVFSDANKLKKLETLIHPLVKKEAQKQKQLLRDQDFEISFYEVPLLFEKNMESDFDCTVCVGAKKEVVLERLKKRNSWSDDEINKRLSFQMSLADKTSRADFYIDNSSDIKTLEQKCNEILKNIRQHLSF